MNFSLKKVSILLLVFLLCITALPIFSYNYGLPYAYNESDAYLQAEYDDWKSSYVTSSGAGVDSLRVKRDGKSDYDTVSEGIGYGMLLALYFDDRDTFDKLYKYVQQHFISTKRRLMHWKVDQDNINVSEFRIPVPHSGSNKKTTYLFIGDPTDPDNILWKIEDQQRYYIDGKKYNSVITSNPTEFVMAAYWDRQLSSASDADFDIAGALVFAHYKWGSTGAINYFEEAVWMIKDIIDMDTSSGFVKNGNAWGGSDCWNPCYFTPAWYKVFIKFMQDFGTQADAIYSAGGSTYTAAKCITDWNLVLTTMFNEMNIINNIPGQVFYPDWADTSSSSLVKPTASDRKYYLDEDNDGLIDDRNTDGKIDENDAYQMMSFNYYYDAVRVPWRQAVMYSWYGDADAYAISDEIANFFKGKVTTLVDGYDIYGGPWKRDDRDGFNPGNGGLYHTVTFISMSACASMTGTDTTYALDFYNEVKTHKEKYADQYHYYGNTVRLLSLLYLSGRFINYSDQPTANLRGQYCTNITSTNTDTISVKVRVYNDDTVDLNIDDIVIKYWYTFEGSNPDVAEIDWAGKLPSGTPITSNVNVNVDTVSPPQGGQDRVLVTSFNSAAGILKPGEYVECQIRIHHSVWASYNRFNQSNDYSFGGNTNFIDWSKIAVYFSGKLVSGVEP